MENKKRDGKKTEGGCKHTHTRKDKNNEVYCVLCGKRLKK